MIITGSGKLVPEIQYMGTRNQQKNGSKQVEQDFSSFFAKFLAYLMFFKVPQHIWRAPC